MRTICALCLVVLTGAARAGAQGAASDNAQKPPETPVPVSASVIVTGEAGAAAPFQGVALADTLIQGLPLFGRSFLAAVSLAPGFSGNPDFPDAQGQFYWTTNVLVDGASDYSRWRGAPRSFYSGYALDSIRSVQVFTHLFSARFGDSLASVVSAQTQAGGSAWRGESFAFARNTALASTPVFAIDKPTTNAQLFGVSAGGPVTRPRTQLFASYEGERIRDRNIVTSPVARGAQVPDNQSEHLAFVRLDHSLGAKQSLSARYSAQIFRWHNEPGGLTLPGSGTAYTNDVHTTHAVYAAALSDNALTTARVQWSRYVDMRRDLNASPFTARAGYSYEGGELGGIGFGVDSEIAVEASDTLLLAFGERTVRLGGTIRVERAHATGVHYAGGAYFFGGSPALFPDPYLYVQNTPEPDAAFVDPRVLAASGFVEYDWHPVSELTLNIGVRYDIERITNVRNYAVPVDSNNVVPRLSAAWSVGGGGRTVIRAGAGLYTQQHLLHAINQAQLQGPDGAVSIALTPMSAGFPRYPEVLTPSAARLAAARDVFRIDSTLRNPYSVQVGGGVQQQILGAIVSADYLHLRGLDLVSVIDANAPESIVKPAMRSVEAADATRPLEPGPSTYRKVLTIGNEGDSWYRALQIAVNRSAGRLQGVTTYTLSRAEDRANYQLPEDSRNLAAERARASTDVRHNIAVAVVFRFPGARAWTRGWTASGIGTFRSNRPYTIAWGDDRNGTTQHDARPGPRNTGRTGPYRVVDGSLSRTFGRNRVTADVRADVFNLFNTVNYDQYVGQLLSPLYGRPVTAFPSRRVQLGLVVRF